MNNPSNLPPGVSDRMIEEQANGPEWPRFTPGPWIADFTSDQRGNDIIRTAAPVAPGAVQGVIIAKIVTRMKGSLGDYRDNARLMAAAPDFYSACTGGHEPGVQRIDWLQTMLKRVVKDGLNSLAEDFKTDPHAMFEAFHEGLTMCEELRVAMRKVRGE